MQKNTPPENIPTDFKDKEADNRPEFIKKLDKMLSASVEKARVPLKDEKNASPAVIDEKITPSFNPNFKIKKQEEIKKTKEAEAKRVSYIKKVMSFYFAPLLRSFATVLYLIFFLYFVIFYFENIIVAIRFLLYTAVQSTLALSLDHLFWGAFFLIALVVPFSVSMYAIFIPFEVSQQSHWNKAKKVAVILFAFIATIDIVIISDFSMKFLEKQRPIRKFLYDKEIVIRKTY